MTHIFCNAGWSSYVAAHLNSNLIVQNLSFFLFSRSCILNLKLTKFKNECTVQILLVDVQYCTVLCTRDRVVLWFQSVFKKAASWTTTCVIHRTVSAEHSMTVFWKPPYRVQTVELFLWTHANNYDDQDRRTLAVFYCLGCIIVPGIKLEIWSYILH